MKRKYSKKKIQRGGEDDNKECEHAPTIAEIRKTLEELDAKSKTHRETLAECEEECKKIKGIKEKVASTHENRQKLEDEAGEQEKELKELGEKLKTTTESLMNEIKSACKQETLQQPEGGEGGEGGEQPEVQQEVVQQPETVQQQETVQHEGGKRRKRKNTRKRRYRFY